MSDTPTSTVTEPAPTIACPFPYQVNPHVEHARAHLLDWTRRIGLVHRETALRRFERADFGWFAAMVYPTATRTHVELMADWFAWLFLVDDQLDDGAAGRTPGDLRGIVGRLTAVLESPDLGARSADDRSLPTAVSSLADLWARTAGDADANWRRRFIRHLDDCLTTAATWEAENRVNGVVPDEGTYVVNRRHTGAIYVCMDLIDIVERIDLPESVYDSPEFTAALDAACNVVCWTNDVYSLDKERSLGEVHNLVYVVQRHRNLDQDAALAHVCAAISAETELFLARETELLRAFPGEIEVLTRYLAGMRSWMRGNLDWSRRTLRYRGPDAAAEPRPEEYLERNVLAVER